MAYLNSTYASGADYFSVLAASILPSNNWVVVKDIASEKVFRLPYGQGYIALIISGDICEIQSFQTYDPAVPAKLQVGGYSNNYTPFLPRVKIPAGAVARRADCCEYVCFVSAVPGSGRRLFICYGCHYGAAE